MEESVLNGYVGFETAKILKKLGFNMICNSCWSMYPHHNNEPLGCDEEYELRAEGKDNEISFKPYWQSGFNSNNAMWGKDKDIWTCPSFEEAIGWLYHTFDIYVNATPYMGQACIEWCGEVYNLWAGSINVFKKYHYAFRYEALNYTIYLACEHILKDIKHKKNKKNESNK